MRKNSQNSCRDYAWKILWKNGILKTRHLVAFLIPEKVKLRYQMSSIWIVTFRENCPTGRSSLLEPCHMLESNPEISQFAIRPVKFRIDWDVSQIAICPAIWLGRQSIRDLTAFKSRQIPKWIECFLVLKYIFIFVRLVY